MELRDRRYERNDNKAHASVLVFMRNKNAAMQWWYQIGRPTQWADECSNRTLLSRARFEIYDDTLVAIISSIFRNKLRSI